MRSPAQKCSRLRKTLARQLSDSFTNRKNTELSWDHRTTRTTSEDCRRNTAWRSCVYCLYYRIKCIIPNGRLVLNHFPQWWQAYHIHWEFVHSKGRDVYSKRRKSWCYLLTIAQLRYGLRMAELFNIQLKVHSGCQHEKSSWICLAAVLRPKTSCEFRSKRNWSSTIRLLYGFRISYRGPAAALQNRAIFSN